MQPQSMTGYGRGEAGAFRVEIRSSNHKNIDIHINLPYYLFSFDPEIRKRVKRKFSRGRIEIYVHRQDAEDVKLKVNKSFAREYYNALLSLKKELSIAGDVGIDLIASQRDIFAQDEPEINAADFYDALEIALEELRKSRIEEGGSLVDDIAGRIGMLRTYINRIEGRSQDFAASARQRLLDRIKELLGDVPIDESRIIQETAILVEKCDITEEIVRIKSHLNQFGEVLKSGNIIGKKMDFFIQELRREVNTTGSKSQDVEISTNVVEMKHELEKIKEQIQNLQ